MWSFRFNDNGVFGTANKVFEKIKQNHREGRRNAAFNFSENYLATIYSFICDQAWSIYLHTCKNLSTGKK